MNDLRKITLATPTTCLASGCDKPRPIIIFGPTAGGKSELAVDLAEALEGEIIGADSMQVYRHMDAGTAKPSEHLRRRVKHHLIDIVNPTERFTVADWFQRADGLIGQLQSRHRRPIVVGGTNLYMKALLEGLFEGPPANLTLRQQLAPLTGQQLHHRLSAVDPEAAGRIHPNDRKKLVRALEVYQTTGQPISQLQSQWTHDPTDNRPYRHHPILIGLDWPVAAINQRINRRVQQMFYPEKVNPQAGQAKNNQGLEESLPQETHRLEQQGLLGPQAREALGYKQILASLQGRYSLEEAFEQTKILTRRFAKNQRSWLRRFRQVTWISMANNEIADVRHKILDIVT